MKIRSNTIATLLLAVAVGIAAGFFIPETGMKAVLAIKQISGQVIFFLVPLIIVGFVAPSIAALRGNVSRLLALAFLLAYVSSVGAALFALFMSYHTIPLLDIHPGGAPLRSLPELLFRIDIPPVLNVMSALLLAVFLGLGSYWIRSGECERLLSCFQSIVLQLVKRILVPVLPFFVASNFCCLSYEGKVEQLTVFLPAILIVVVCHYVWLFLLYALASAYSGTNGWRVLRHYAPAYLTALGTMSSAATLGVALECARKSPVLDRKVTDFAIPLFANIHLCGSVLTEVFFVCVVSQLLYGHLPELPVILLFIFLLGIFAVGAPGVPGGTVLASLGIVVSVLGFDEAGTALLITMFALQDSFGTACNVVGDGALSLAITKFSAKDKKKEGTEATF